MARAAPLKILSFEEYLAGERDTEIRSTIPSLLEYVVVSQDTPYLQIFRRRNHWQPESCNAEDTFVLDSVGLEITVKQIYRRVKREVGLEVRLPSQRST